MLDVVQLSWVETGQKVQKRLTFSWLSKPFPKGTVAKHKGQIRGTNNGNTHADSAQKVLIDGKNTHAAVRHTMIDRFSSIASRATMMS